jgi:hypothetical protein
MNLTQARRVYAKSLSESSLACDYPGETLPEEIDCLIPRDRACLGPDGRQAWPRLSTSQRIALLERSRRETAQREA